MKWLTKAAVERARWHDDMAALCARERDEYPRETYGYQTRDLARAVHRLKAALWRALAGRDGAV